MDIQTANIYCGLLCSKYDVGPEVPELNNTVRHLPFRTPIPWAKGNRPGPGAWCCVGTEEGANDMRGKLPRGDL